MYIINFVINLKDTVLHTLYIPSSVINEKLLEWILTPKKLDFMKGVKRPMYLFYSSFCFCLLKWIFTLCSIISILINFKCGSFMRFHLWAWFCFLQVMSTVPGFHLTTLLLPSIIMWFYLLLLFSLLIRLLFIQLLFHSSFLVTLSLHVNFAF